jgi:hypothetical protein
MTTNAMARPWRTPLAWSAVSRAARCLTVGFLGWLWLSAADDPARRAVSLVAGPALAALVGITWFLSCAETGVDDAIAT